MKLIIAEKPELGRAIADAIPGSGESKDGCIYKGDYVITWAYGHLLTLKEPEDYDAEYKKWNLDVLPIYFDNWGKKPISQTMGGGKGLSKSQRLNQIGKLLKECEYVIHAGDPDDEGQYLIDEILTWHKYKGTVKRINTNDTTPAALRKALNNLDDNKKHEATGWSAHARSVADLMVGVNCSRYFTLQNPGALLTVGRVQTSTLGLVVNRDEQIENHITQKYYEVFADMLIDDRIVTAKYEPKKDDPNLEDGKILNRNYAEEKTDVLRDETVNAAVKYTEIQQQPPLPFNLTELQSYCSSHWNYDPTETLEITQKLRDNYSAITYNRSDCQYLTEEQYKNSTATIAQTLKNIGGRIPGIDPTIHSRCFDDGKITAHTAIIPQNHAVLLNTLSEKEKNVYLAICKYYLAQFLPPATKGRTELVSNLRDGAKLKATSTVIVKPGYLKLFKNDKAEKKDDEESSALSEIKPGKYSADITAAKVEEKTTKPPARYTKASLNKDMTRIARYVKDPKIKKLLLSKDEGKEGENGSIGTVATRGTIIDKLVERGYFEMKGKQLISTPLGRELYRILPDELKKPDMTALWWSIQDDIAKGQRLWTDLTDSVYEMIKRVVKTNYPKVNMSIIPEQYKRSGTEKSGSGSSESKVIGKCPRCGGDITEFKLGFGCSNKDCKFIIWKKSKMPMLSKTTITAKDVKALLAGKPIKKSSLLKKDGSKFEASLVLKDDPNSPYGPDFEFVRGKR